jgi:hypothetical protein
MTWHVFQLKMIIIRHSVQNLKHECKNVTICEISQILNSKKVKFIIERAMKTQIGSRGIALLFL